MSKILNPHDINRLLERGSPQLTKAMKQALRRALEREAGALREVTTYPNPPPPNLTREEFEANGPFYVFVPDAMTLSIITAIELWLSKAISDRAPWIDKVDDSGRITRLRNVKTLSQVIDLCLADEEDSRRQKARAEDLAFGNAPEHAAPVLRLANDFAVVRLLTPASLSWEGQRMGHCLGNPTYATCLAKGYADYYSIRDAAGRPRVTLEVSNGRLYQCKGRANSDPYPRYKHEITTLACALDWEFCDPHAPAEVEDSLYAEHCTAQDIDIRGDFGFADFTQPLRLPRTMQVSGSFIVRACPTLTTLPEVMNVGGDLIVENCVNLRRMPVMLRVGGDVDFSGCVSLPQLPLNFHAGGSLDLSRCRSVDLSRSQILIGRGLDITGCRSITRIPPDVRIGGAIRRGRTTFAGREAINRSLGKNR
jgi:hypothetical protein